MRNLLESPLARRYRLIHFETGSRGTESPARDESLRAKVGRLAVSPARLAWAIARSRPQVVHLNSAMDHKAFWRDLVYLAISRLLGRRVVLQLHGGSLTELCAGARMRELVRRVYSMADALVLLASSEQREMVRLGIVERFCVIPNGIDVSRYGDPGGRIHSGHVHRIAYLGRLVRSKGIFEAMEAVRRLRVQPQFAGIELEVAGSGPDEEAIRAWIRAHAMERVVTLRGPLYGENKIEFLRAADVLVFPTYHQEGLPYVILESLAAGTPVIATHNAGIPDVVVDGVHGRLVGPRDPDSIAIALQEMGASPAGLQAMSRDCLARAHQAFGLDRLARQFQDLYERLEFPGSVAGEVNN